MLTAETVVGKVVSFICEKAATHIIKLSGDKRRKACRSLTKLYYTVQALAEVTEVILEAASNSRSTKTGEAYAVMNALNNHMHEVAQATNMFMDLGQELYAGLEIIDPALAECCDALYVSKFDFLSEMSNTIAWDRTTSPGSIVVKMPRRTVETETLERAYSEILDAYRRGEKTYWPDTWTRVEGPGEIILTWEDHVAAEAFLQRLTGHRMILVDANNRLRQLLKSNFTIEELLFQTDTYPHR